MNKFDIPLYLQKIGSADCGSTCVKMLLAYFGIEKDLEELQKDVLYSEIGTTMFDNGSLLLDHGLKTTVITAQPLLFSPEIVSKIANNEDLLKVIDLKIEKSPKFKDNLETWKKYLDKGGQVKIEIPDFSHIKEAIDNEYPVLVLFYGQPLGQHEGIFHFVVVSGYDDEKVFINNPWPPSKQQDWYPIKEFMYAVHSSTTADIDNGSFLIVSK